MMTEAQIRMYRNICIEDAYHELKGGMPRTANLIIQSGFTEEPNIKRAIWHLQRLVRAKSCIFGVHLLLAELQGIVASISP